jgi:Domain of unknown function (DUF1996)
MRASSQRTWQVRLALMVIVGVSAAAACVVTFMWWKAPAASGQETTPTEPSFVVKCDFSHRDRVDPIVDFGINPSHHMHEFFGNTTTNENSTYQTLRAGGTNCDDPKDTAAYWIPRVSWTDSRGNTTKLTASITRFYYRLGDKSPNVDVNPHPALDTNGDGQLDDGLKIVTVQGKNVEWRCMNTGAWSTTPPSRCDNLKLVVRIKFPDCLDVARDERGQPIIDPTTGKPIPRLDSPDHRSHMVDAVQPASGGKATCPTSHPYPVPRLQTNVEFPIPATRGKPKLSSGAYSTMHADFFNAWDQQRLDELVQLCINKAPFTATNPKDAQCG